MEIFVTTRKVEKIDIDEEILLDYLKNDFPHDEEIQAATKLEDIGDVEDIIGEVADELVEDDAFTKTLVDSSIYGCLSHEEAYQVMEWGIH